MRTEQLICEIAGSRLNYSSRLAMIRLAVAYHPMTTQEIMQALNVGRRQVDRALAYPIAAGLVRKNNGGRHGGPACTYELI